MNYMEEKPKRSSWVMWLVVAMVLLVVYPLSIIPAYSLAEAGHIPYGTVLIYEPLGIIGDWLPRTLQDRLLQWMVRWHFS